MSGAPERSPTVTETDVVVLGVGTSGEDLALRLLDAGLEVVGVEASLVGGECPYWACLPSKMMIRAASALAEARRVDSLAGRASVRPDWAPVAARIRSEATGGWDDTVATKRFEARGGTLVHGRGTVIGPRRVGVGELDIAARRGIVVATGSTPLIPPIPGIEGVDVWTTHDVVQAEDLPGSLIVLGGGAVGCELGQVLARFGVQVTIVEAADRLLAAEEPEASSVVEAGLAADRVEVRAGRRATGVSEQDGEVVVDLDDGSQIAAERLLVATGRTVDLQGLGLDAAGVDVTADHVAVDDRMRAADGLWAMGDVTRAAMFTHVALYQAAVIAADILGEDRPPARYHAIPHVTFTDPEVGSVGMTEAEARAAGLDVEVAVKHLPATFRGWLHATGDGVIKLVADRATGTLLGATAAGPQGGEVLGLLTLAVHAHVPISELRSMIYAFPTFHGGVGEAVEAFGRGLATILDPGYQGLHHPSGRAQEPATTT